MACPPAQEMVNSVMKGGLVKVVKFPKKPRSHMEASGKFNKKRWRIQLLCRLLAPILIPGGARFFNVNIPSHRPGY